jgi:OOP family OmpA-OmpF porin
MALRAEVRDVFLFKGRNDVIALVGISYLFGKSAEHSAPIKEEVALVKKTEAVVKPAPIVVDGDNDGDGIVDSADKCRLTPKGTAVDKNGCPLDADKDNVTDALDKCPGTLAGVSVDEAGCHVDADKYKVAYYLDKCLGTSAGVTVDKNGCPIPLDADKDNVTDALDKCPGTLAGVAVDEAGCPVDADKDKVADYLDKCLSTPSGAKVDSNGCVVSVTLNVTFDSGKAVVKAEHDAEITKLANFLKENPDLKVEIQGHTDNVGNANTNKKLSEDRAMAIKQRLVTQNGIASDRVTSVGYGQEKPIASNDTAEGKLANRRVEAVILK